MLKVPFQADAAPQATPVSADRAPIVVDVRTPEEFAQGHVPGARNIPVQELDQRHAELGSEKAVPIVLYCRSGARSALAARMLAQLGFSQVKDIGTMSNWHAYRQRAH